jgi:hypothetical protein
VEQRRFFNPTQPQTLQVAVFLLYANVLFALLFRTGDRGVYALSAFSLTRGNLSASTATLIGNLLTIFVVGGSFAAAYLMANEKKVGWRLGVAVAAAPLIALVILILIGYPRRLPLFDAIDINLLFDVALLVLLLHDQTRSYERLWFK